MGNKIIPLKQHKVGMVDDNILINGKVATAYYLLPLYNYRVMAHDAIGAHISALETALLSVESMFSNITCSIFKTSVLSTKQQKVERLVRTCRGWDQFYQVPEMFKSHIHHEKNDYAVLAVDIDKSKVADVESMSVGQLAKHFYNQAVEQYTGGMQMNVFVEQVKSVESNIRKILRRYAVPVSREMLMNIYVRNVFPSYDINIDSTIAANDVAIATAMQQEFIPHFGWFEMSNTGVEILGAQRQTTYGALLSILEFPDQINSDNMNLDIPGMRTTFQILKKQQAQTKIKRARADIEYEQESAMVAGARDLDLEDYKDLAERALAGLANDRMLCEMNCNILLLDTDLDNLKQQKQNLLTSLREIDIIAAVSRDQCKDYVQNYIQVNVDKNNWDHLTELRYPLSFQLDSGILLGDNDSQYEAPNIADDRVELDM